MESLNGRLANSIASFHAARVASGAFMNIFPKPTTTPASGLRMTRVRWWILGLLFFCTTLNYLDRMVMGILAPDLQRQSSSTTFSTGTFSPRSPCRMRSVRSFPVALLDICGNAHRLLARRSRLGASVRCCTPRRAARGDSGFRCAPCLGVSESPAFPSAAKSVARMVSPPRTRVRLWFRQRRHEHGRDCSRRRSFRGWRSSYAVHWQWAFIATGRDRASSALAFLDSVLSHAAGTSPRITPPNLRTSTATRPSRRSTVPLDHACSGSAGVGVCGVENSLTDSMWWFYLAWFPKFLNKRHGVDLIHSRSAPHGRLCRSATSAASAAGWFSSSDDSGAAPA